METWRNRDMETQGHGDMETFNGKRKSRPFSLLCLPFAHCASESSSFFRLLMNKQPEVIRLQTD
jgi:hypothetical protein